MWLVRVLCYGDTNKQTNKQAKQTNKQTKWMDPTINQSSKMGSNTTQFSFVGIFDAINNQPTH
jgi:hypothetical protein